MNREEFLKQLAVKAPGQPEAVINAQTAEQIAVDLCRALNGPECCPPRDGEAVQRKQAKPPRRRVN